MPTGVFLSDAVLAAMSPATLAEIARALPPGLLAAATAAARNPPAEAPARDGAEPAAGGPPPPLVDPETGLANLTMEQARPFFGRYVRPRPRAMVEVFCRMNRNRIPDTEMLAALGPHENGVLQLGSALSGITSRGRNVTGARVDVIHYPARGGLLSVSPATLSAWRRVWLAQGGQG